MAWCVDGWRGRGSRSDSDRHVGLDGISSDNSNLEYCRERFPLCDLRGADSDQFRWLPAGMGLVSSSGGDRPSASLKFEMVRN